MDISMSSTQGVPPTWDLVSVSGIVSWIKGDAEKLQAAQLAAYLNLGSTPQLPDQGTDWTGFFTGNTTFGTIDSQIRTNINNSIGQGFYPDYELVNNKMKVTIKQG